VDGKGAIRIHCTKYRLRVEAIINQPRTDTLRDDVAGRHSFDGVESIYRWVNYLVRINKEERQINKPSVRKHNTQGGCVCRKSENSLLVGSPLAGRERAPTSSRLTLPPSIRYLDKTPFSIPRHL